MSEDDRIARLELRLDRERRRRREAEEIAEAKTRHLYDVNQALEARNEELDLAIDELRSLLYTVTHDVRNPVVVLIGYLELWRTDHASGMDEQQRVELDAMLNSARYVRSLIHDLLSLGRIGQDATEPVAVDVADLVAEIKGNVRRIAPAVTIEAGPLPVLLADPTQVRQLVLNLVDNALAHGGRDDLTIRISAAARPDGGVDLDVADDGRGVDASHREAIFGLFHREARGRDAESTGIGLAICRKVARGLGGDIEMAPSAAGATFRISLPAEAVAVDPR